MDPPLERREEESSGEVGDGEFCVWWDVGEGTNLDGIGRGMEDVFAVGNAGVVETGGERENG